MCPRSETTRSTTSYPVWVQLISVIKKLEELNRFPTTLLGLRSSEIPASIMVRIVLCCDDDSWLVDITRSVEPGPGEDQDETQTRFSKIRVSGVQDQNCVTGNWWDIVDLIKLWLSSPCSLWFVINSGYEAYFTILVVYLVYYLYYYVCLSIIYVLFDPDRLALSTDIHQYK